MESKTPDGIGGFALRVVVLGCRSCPDNGSGGSSGGSSRKRSSAKCWSRIFVHLVNQQADDVRRCCCTVKEDAGEE